MENKKKEKTKIDIILPNYNSSQFIVETVNSIINQTYKNWKLIIVDDFSDRKTVNILKKISKNKKIKFFLLKKIKVQVFVETMLLKNLTLLISPSSTRMISGKKINLKIK